MNAEDEALLRRIEAEIAESATRRETKILARYLTEDFVGVGARGELLTKSEILARFTAQGYDVDSIRHEDVRVQLHGDTAVVVARSVVQGRYQGKALHTEARYMRVWVKRSGEWRAISTQSTLIPPVAAP